MANRQSSSSAHFAFELLTPNVPHVPLQTAKKKHYGGEGKVCGCVQAEGSGSNACCTGSRGGANREQRSKARCCWRQRIIRPAQCSKAAGPHSMPSTCSGTFQHYKAVPLHSVCGCVRGPGGSALIIMDRRMPSMLRCKCVDARQCMVTA